jgi:hypothetical protein
MIKIIALLLKTLLAGPGKVTCRYGIIGYVDEAWTIPVVDELRHRY